MALTLASDLVKLRCIKRDTPTANVFTSLFINRNQLHATIFKKYLWKLILEALFNFNKMRAWHAWCRPIIHPCSTFFTISLSAFECKCNWCRNRRGGLLCVKSHFRVSHCFIHTTCSDSLDLLIDLFYNQSHRISWCCFCCCCCYY